MHRNKKGRIKQEVIAGLEKKQKLSEMQEKLQKKYNVTNKEIFVAEKPMLFKFFMHYFVRFIKIFMTIILLFLAMVGLITLIYPSIREPFVQVMLEVGNQFKSFLP